jgi:hypothetical protein
MTVQELINSLQFLDPAAEVHFSYNYGDHWQTQVAPTVNRVNLALIKYSEYHRMNKLLDEDEMYEDEGDLEDTRRVVVLG